MERLMPNLIASAAENLPVGSYLYAKGLDGRGVYRITRVIPEENEVYGVLVDKEPLPKPWWRYNPDAGVASALPRSEFRHVPANKKRRKKLKKKDAAEAW